MASIFNALHIGYSGLNVAQIGINTTGHNISNAEVDGYTRQRVITAAATPLQTYPGNVGNGAQVMDIKRVFDNFVFDRYTDISETKEYSDFETKTLEELSTYFPEIDGVGIKADLTEYYNMWQTFADNPDNDAIKLALATQTKTLTQHIAYTQTQVKSLQSQLNDQLAVNINEVNSIAKQLADLNKSIEIAEAGKTYTANDLRDKRNVMERSLARLIGAVTNAGQIESNIQVDSSSNTKTGSYSVSVNGFNIVDGNSFHPIYLSRENNSNGFYEVSYERQDGTLIQIAEKISGGVVGSILNLRGASLDTTSGMPTDGVVQNVVAQMDAFAKGLIESTNNVYANSATKRMESNKLDLNPTNSLVNSTLNVQTGSFEMIVYDIDGNVTTKREIVINQATTMTGVAGSNSIQGQIEAQIDDNGDGNANNDINNFIQFNWATFAGGGNALELTLDPLAESRGYTFSMQDILKDTSYSSGSNFAGALGMSRYFDGDSAQSISLNYTLANNPTLITPGATPVAGDNVVALNMVQHQYEKFDFYVGNQDFNTTTYAMFDIIATEVGTQTNAAILKNETITTQYNATELEYNSVSKVSLDEEMTNLIKYQTSYGAAAKIITTIDQMMQTLLGIKQ
ncbi:flagellar hook-associated protein FlgK [Sulfurimonas gotlandica GD1]|uniref:Flagellar hook-associated protein 1 n=1 Tax=Sulfurimonas gotlandica (strain DSM 19862 / JCM 16533 / GD1) TaxID=929558 RepID=B6BIU7_SULGG|nr:flagellar hook-associated protein FlgK [Sulfurimonas gotlandica]EDZ63527.1 flagellar hook-associated protein FlgK [Sulfurimonas gotlandica GD1]EHP30457.1 flagellar hook-associated protein FlgK [Sulfurimonas gotlandica GD1]